jgi:putative membrane protein
MTLAPLAHLLVQMIFNARNIASLISASETDVVDDQVKATACRLLVAFGWAAKAHARYEDDLSGVLSALLGEEEAERASAARKPALHVLALLRKTVQPLQLPLAVSEQLQTAISELDKMFGGMERLMSTSLSPTYMRHTSRGLLLWLGFLPAGLLGAGCTTLPKLLLVVLTTAYIMLGIDEIGIQIEQPFDILPLHALASDLTKDVEERLCK